MIEPLTGLPAGVIGFEISGEVHADDYRNVLLPAIDAVTARGDDVRLVLVWKSYEGVSGGALWEDLKVGFEHLKHWKRIALVTDLDWMVAVTFLFGWMSPGEFKRFPAAERDAAVAWAAG